MGKQAIILLAIFLGAVGLGRAETIQDITESVSTNSYSGWHGQLFTSDDNSRGFTYPGSVRVPANQHDPARDFIATSFQSMGFDTWLDPFSFTFFKDGSLYTNCNNVVAVKPGSGGTNVFIVGAHYDSVDPADANVTLCPGADDNASGVAALLETARAIQHRTFRDTIVLIAFDAEEKGFLGAIHFVEEHITDQPALTNATTFLLPAIKGMMSVDSIAYDDPSTPRQIMIGTMGQETNSPIDIALEQAAIRYSNIAPIHGTGWGGSDHNPYHKAGIDAALLIESDFFDYANASDPTFENPYNHTDGDSIDSPGYIVYDYATEATKCIVGYLCDQARVVPPATLYSSVPGGDIFLLDWETTPGVSYALYGIDSPANTNGWNLMEFYGQESNGPLISVQLDIQGSPHTFYKVESR